jgi:short-subunit dehydrogenase
VSVGAVPDRELHALVTGASSGIGAAYARALRARGERLVLVARRAERLAALAAELGGPEAAVTVPLDLTDPDAPARLERTLRERGIGVDLLVNNAGLGHTGRFADSPLPRVTEMLDLNLRALVSLTRLFLPGMLERRRGRIVNVVSTAAFQPVPYMATYAATKAAVLSFSEALAAELRGSGVRVQALCPGLTATEFQRVAGTDRVAFNKTPAATPEAVAAASLSALDRGRERVIVGLNNRLVAAAARFAPRWLTLELAGRLFRPEPDR